MAKLKPFQLLEINIISAQDLEPVAKKMRTYATASVHRNRKLSTQVDTEGHFNPTWNDKFVFRVDEEFLRHDTSTVMIEIYAVNWFRDTLVGTVGVLVGNLIPPPRPRQHHHHLGMRFAALQVRRPSGRPQGILNIGVAVLDSSMRSMPLYTQLSTSAVGYRDLMGEQDQQNPDNPQPNVNVKPILRRSRSERSERVTFDNYSTMKKDGSIISGSSESSKKGKASSLIGETVPKTKGKKGKASSNSILSDSVVSRDPFRDEAKNVKKICRSDLIVLPKKITGSEGNGVRGHKGLSRNGKFVHGGPPKENSLWSDSEVGPSPSEVAAAMLEKKEEERSSVLDGWSLDESVEGLRSKLERWRTELPPIYDRKLSSSHPSTSHHTRRHSDGGNGLFSCFGNVNGYEFQCICGKPSTRKSVNGHFQSPSIGSAGRSFL